jgi:transposase
MISDIDLRDIARGATHDVPSKSQRYRIIAAPSILRRYIKEYAEATARRLFSRVPTITWECHNCKTVTISRRSRDLHQLCANCKASWDQDVNACLVMLQRRDELCI